MISSFECPHCGFKNSQLDPAIEIKKKGVRMRLDVKNKEDLDRYVITTDYTSIQIQELDFEIPPMSQRSQVTTVEGIIMKTLSNLCDQKVLIDSTNPELSGKMQAVIDGLMAIRDLSNPVPMVIIFQ